MASAQQVTMTPTDAAQMPLRRHGQSLERVVAQPTTATPHRAASFSWKESFEDAPGDNLFWLPSGWTSQRTPAFMADANDPHTWTVQRQLSLFYPEPVDGNYYACAYYSDEVPQDEWICSPLIQPKQSEWLTYYVILDPLWLFNLNYFNESTVSFSKKEVSADMQLHIKVDGGEWQMVHSLYDIYKDANISELYDLSHMGYLQQRKMFLDMKPYVGHSVQLGFRYVGVGGNTIFLDDIELTPITLTASYAQPAAAMFFGMTRDFQQPSSALFIPDGTVTWNNTSSAEALSYDWAYASTSDLSQTSHKTSANLITTYKTYVPEAQQVTGQENLAPVPVLTVEGVGGLTASYQHPAAMMQIGGRSHVTLDGIRYETGATFADPQKGNHVLVTSGGVPYFGVGEGNKALWTKLFSVEAWVTGFGTKFDKPVKPVTMRGAWLQGIGNVERAYKLRLVVRQMDVYGELTREPVATAIIDVNNIVAEDIPGSTYKRYTLPFLFADPYVLNKDSYIFVEGLEEAASWFAPLQTQQLEDDENLSRAIFSYAYMDGARVYESEDFVSNLGVLDETGKTRRCTTNFYINFDMGYADTEEWGHLDIEIPGPPMPELNCEENRMVAISTDTGISIFGEEFESMAMRCAFYDESNPDSLTLHLCIGQLYELEGGPFYSDDLFNTYHLTLRVPRSIVGQGEQKVDGTNIMAKFYTIDTHRYEFVATTGSVEVSASPVGDHCYKVHFKGLDNVRSVALETIVNYADAWRWRDYNEERPHPSQYEVRAQSVVREHYDILSCVVDMSNETLPVFYLASQADLTTVAQVTALEPQQYVSIQCPTSLMDGNIKGFSALKNDDLTITFRGNAYCKSGTVNDAMCYGGNVQVVEFDMTKPYLEINSTIYSMIPESLNSLYIHYEGGFVVDNPAAIETLSAPTQSSRQAYDVMGRPVSRPTQGQLYIRQGQTGLVSPF